MSRAPAPMVPAEVDLRAFHWMPLHHRRLRRSAFWLRASDQVKAISVELWCEAYEQVPAGSLPDDDVALCGAAGFSRREIEAWLAVKAEVMSAWRLCSDGRWYHPFLCTVVMERWAEISSRRERERDKKRRQRENKKPGVAGSNKDVPVDVPPESALSRPIEDRIGQEIKTPLLAQGSASPPDDASGDDAFLFGLGDMDTPAGVDVGVDTPAKPPAVIPPAKPKGDKRGTRLPADWEATPALVDYALSKGLTPAEVDDELEQFKLWWPAQPGQKGVKLDWDMTWQTWAVRAAKNRGRIGNGGTGTRAERRRDDRDESRAAMHRGAVAASQRPR